MLLWVLGAVIVFWFGLALFNLWSLRGATILRPDSPVADLAETPKVSIILAARNEEEALPSTLDSLLRLDYPDYEVILIDDDSHDHTGAIAEEWAEKPEAAGRLKVIHNSELPAGWSGKVHALSLAARAATGEWLLATDADLVFHNRILRVAMACAREKRVSLLSLTPEFEYSSFWEKVVLPAFAWVIASVFPVRLVNDPRSSRALAAGAFILMRRADFAALGGYERLRNTVIEDLRTAQLFKSGGRRIHFAATKGLFRTRMYKNLRELWEGLTRTSFEGVGFSVPTVLAGVTVGAVAAVLPSVTSGVRLFRDWEVRISPLQDHVLLMALAACAVSFLVYLPVLAYFHLPARYVFSLPLAAAFYCLVALDSMLVSVAGRGVPWKGRRYLPPGSETG